MTTTTTTSTARRRRMVGFAAAAAVAALVAAACGSDTTPAADPAAPAVTEPSATTAEPAGAAAAPDAVAAPDTTPAADPAAPAVTEPSATTTTVAQTGTAADIEEGGESPRESEVPFEQVCIDGVCLDVPADGGPVELPEGFANHEHPPETEPGYQPESGTVPEPETDPESEQVATTTVAPEPDPEPTSPDSEPEVEDPTSTTLAPEPETEPEPEPTSTTLAPEPEPTTTTTAPQPPTTTAPLPEQVRETIYLVLDPDDLDCDPEYGCYEPVHLEVGSHVVWPPIGGSETTGRVGVVTSLEIDELWSSATVDFCTYDPSWGGYNWTRHGARVDPDGSIRVYGGGDYRGSC